jgi:hypothetical protein
LSSIHRLDKEFGGLFQNGDDKEGDDTRGGRDTSGNFMRKYGWIYQVTIIAEHEKIRLEEAYELPTIQALNDLSYIKSKQAHDSEQMKQIYAKH